MDAESAVLLIGYKILKSLPWQEETREEERNNCTWNWNIQGLTTKDKDSELNGV